MHLFISEDFETYLRTIKIRIKICISCDFENEYYYLYSYSAEFEKRILLAADNSSPQAPDKFNPKVNLQTCGIIQMLYETKQIETMMFGKSVIALFSK